MIGFALRILCASVIFAIAPTSVDWLSQATAAETESGIVELVTHPKSSADQQKLIKWHEQREDEVRHQAEFYRKLAQGYRATTMTTACEEIARYYDEIAQQFEKLAEQHGHLAAHAP